MPFRVSADVLNEGQNPFAGINEKRRLVDICWRDEAVVMNRFVNKKKVVTGAGKPFSALVSSNESIEILLAEQRFGGCRQ